MAERSDDSADVRSVEVGPVKLRIEGEKSLVLVTCTTKSGLADCRIRVFQCLTVPSRVAKPFSLRPPDDTKKGPLLYDFTITPSTVINLDKFECNHGKPKLAVVFYQREDDVGGTAHKELVFKELSRTGNHVAKLEQLLRQGPFKDMHPFDVDIAPRQSIPEGPVRLTIFPTHISVAKKYKLKQQKNANKKGPGQIAMIKRKMRELPMVVRLKDLDNFSTLPLGLRFEVLQQCYFFCCNEGGEDMNSLIASYRHIVTKSAVSAPIVLPGVGNASKVQHPHKHLRRLMSESGLGTKHPPLQRQVSAPAIVFEMVEEGPGDAVSNEAPPPLPVRSTPSPSPPTGGPPLPPKTRSRCNTISEISVCTDEVAATHHRWRHCLDSEQFWIPANHYANEWAARRCTEVLQGGIKLNVAVLAKKPQLGQTWIVYVLIYRQGVPLKDVKENFPGMDIVCPPRAFQLVQHLSINVELPIGWSTKEIIKEIEMDRFCELTDHYIYTMYDVCIEHKDMDQKQFHGKINIRQGLTEILTLNIITNFSLYERVGQKRTGEPLYDLVPATREPTVKGQEGLLQQFSVRLQFCNKLDIPNIFGNDIRLLAEKIGLDYQAILAIETRSRRTGQSPTELVLREWETGQSAVPFSQNELVRILHDMGRPDVIQDLALQVPKLKDVKVAATTANTIRITWDLDTPDVTECTIKAKPVGSDCRTWAEYIQNNSNRTFLLRDLEPDMEYLIHVVPSFQRVAGEMVEVRARTDAVPEEEVNADGEEKVHCKVEAHDSMDEDGQWEDVSADVSSESVCSESRISTFWNGYDSAEALIGRDGGMLMLSNAATSLLFSPHSISNQIDITLEILHDPAILPDLREDETLIGPIVCCGPHGWTFHKPVRLTFPHCGMSDFTLLVSETSSQQAPNWVEVNSATSGIEYLVTSDECLVSTTHFTLFALKSRGPKKVRLVAFSNMSATCSLYQLRIYCVNDTKDALHCIKKQEREYGFKQTAPGISMTFLSNKNDIRLKAHLETPGWKFLNSTQELAISYDSIHGKRDGYVSFKLEAEPEFNRHIISVSIGVSQDGNSDSQTLSVAEEVRQIHGQASNQGCGHRGACNCNTSKQVSVVQSHTMDCPSTVFQKTSTSHRNLTIPHKLRRQICIKLDPKMPGPGDDWRDLAAQLGLDELIPFYDSKPEPTEMVLQEFEKRGKTLEDLRLMLRGMGRQDVAFLVEEYLQTTSSKLPAHSSDSGVDGSGTEALSAGFTTSPMSDNTFFPHSPASRVDGEKAISPLDLPQSNVCEQKTAKNNDVPLRGKDDESNACEGHTEPKQLEEPETTRDLTAVVTVNPNPHVPSGGRYRLEETSEETTEDEGSESNQNLAAASAVNPAAALPGPDLYRCEEKGEEKSDSFNSVTSQHHPDSTIIQIPEVEFSSQSPQDCCRPITVPEQQQTMALTSETKAITETEV